MTISLDALGGIALLLVAIIVVRNTVQGMAEDLRSRGPLDLLVELLGAEVVLHAGNRAAYVGCHVHDRGLGDGEVRLVRRRCPALVLLHRVSA